MKIGKLTDKHLKRLLMMEHIIRAHFLMHDFTPAMLKSKLEESERVRCQTCKHEIKDGECAYKIKGEFYHTHWNCMPGEIK